ncbi:MAG TPA: DUF3488 and transglutaminase-like domain-containing protein [bacterium]|nr:DUF3488 and transglutaminase-like domain-containing protein [bacterium]
MAPRRFPPPARSLAVETAFGLSLLLTIAAAHLCLLLTREIHPLHALAMAASLFLAVFVKRLRRIPPWTWNALIIILLVLCAASALTPPRSFESYFRAISYFLIYTLIIRYLTRATPRDELVVLLLCLLEVSAASIMTISMTFFASLAFFTVCATSALLLFSLKQQSRAVSIQRERIQAIERAALGLKTPAAPRPAPVPVPGRFFGFSAAFALAVFIVGFVFFFTIPRVGRGLFSWKTGIHSRVSGFSDTVEFGSLGKIKLSNALVMRVQMDDAAGAGLYYFRGNALEFFDGRAWSDNLGLKAMHRFSYQETVTLDKISSLANSVKQEIILEPIETGILFGIPSINSVAVPFQFRAVLEYHNGYISLPLDTPVYDRVAYTVWSTPLPEGARACEEMRDRGAAGSGGAPEPAYLSMPSGMERIADLARRVAGNDPSPCARAENIRQYLLMNYAYDLDTPSDAAPDPITDFLFNSRTGYCQHFATAMVLMLRGVGIPARIANGYLAGADWNPIDNYLSVRESDAHTWVEMLLPAGRWIMFDPTPAAAPPPRLPAWQQALKDVFDAIKYRWDLYVVDLNLHNQYHMALTIRERGIMATRSIAGLPARTTFLIRSILRSYPLLLAIPAALAVYLLWARNTSWLGAGKQRPGRPAVRAMREYERLLKALGKRGLRRRASETALELARRIEAGAWPFARPVSEATEAYLALRFGPPRPDARAVALIQSALAAVTRPARP